MVVILCQFCLGINVKERGKIEWGGEGNYERCATARFVGVVVCESELNCVDIGRQMNVV